MTPTSEQSAICSLGSGSKSNLMLNALAGCGKTSTLRMIERTCGVRPILYLVFNKRNAEEAEYRPKADKDEAANRMLSTTTVRTFNSIGHRIWAQSTGKNLSLDPKKSQAILRTIIDEIKAKDARDAIWAVFWEVVSGVALAKALGYVPEGKFLNAKRLCSQTEFHSQLEERPDDLVSDLINAVLVRSIQASYEGSIDYNDQIYMPALFGGTYPQFPLIFVDEYQDLNPTNHAMLEKLVRKRVVGVGDPNQSIYAFRGAKLQGFEKAIERYSATEAPLSISFRCPSEIVKHVHWRVPHFKWLKEGGNVEQANGSYNGSDIGSDAAIICRNNSPLFRLAFQLIHSGRSVSVAGSDIGPKLVAQMKKLGPEDLSRASVLSAIQDWLWEKLEKESKTATDMAECMKIFASQGETLGQAIAYAEHLFAQRGAIRLLTGHKSKGLEFDTVYHLDPWLCSESEQDKNLRYVISTRSRNRLIELDSQAIKW